MANNYLFPPANFPAQRRQPGHWRGHVAIAVFYYYIWVFITNKGAQIEKLKTSTDMRTAVNALEIYGRGETISSHKSLWVLGTLSMQTLQTIKQLIPILL